MSKHLTDNNLLNYISQLWHHFSYRRRLHFIMLFILTFVSALAEIINIGTVLPFIGILTTPDRVFDQLIIKDIALSFNITSGEQLVLPITIVFILATLTAGIIRFLLLWLRIRLAYAAGADLSRQVYYRTLYQPYSVHVARNSSEIISGITIKVGSAINVINNVLILITSATLIVFIVSALIVIKPVVAMVTTVGLGAIYCIIALSLRRQLKNNSQIISKGNTAVVKILQEGLGGIRDIILDNTQKFYCDTHHKVDFLLRKAQGKNQFIAGCPRFLLEVVIMILIAVLAYVLSLKADGIITALPLFGVLTLSAQRLLPALQQSYSAWAVITGSQAVLANVLELLNQELPPEVIHPSIKQMNFCESIQFDNVSFRYSNDGQWVLRDMNLTINKRSRVGIIGTTGCGKSTTIDIMMGLLMPSEGSILVDGQLLNNDRLWAWQRNIAHVPQDIYLSDNTVAENIAFGIPLDQVDMARVYDVANKAQLNEFINNLSDGYNTIVGERGVRLSGGQRQRIGIARALYKRASILVFDEATSALDSSTEKSILDAINSLSRDLTIIMIAHRITTVQNCDIIYEIDRGKVVSSSNYNELIDKTHVLNKITS